jgi:tRNA 5-methylaminomethyl-2-thiouridine biosynthesis bifunctional protein
VRSWHSRADPQPAGIVPAELRLREDGVPFSERFDDVYFSHAGGLAEARHIFLVGNELPQRWVRAQRFTIVETGFGTGLNFLATWQAWQTSAEPGARLHYVAVEKHPLARDDLARTCEMWTELTPFARELIPRYPPPVGGFHRLHLAGNRIALTLLFGDATAMLARLDAAADAFFLDGFAPAKNPDMWTTALFRELARLAAPGATLATYTVAGGVRRALASAGFRVEKRPGFGHKREMLVGVLADAARQTQVGAPSRHAAVIGAGLAGTACAERLAARGWSVDLVERHPGAAREASANPVGIFHPALLVDRRTRSAFTTAATLYAKRQLEALDRASCPVRWRPTGVLQVSRDPRRLERLVRACETIGLPESVARRSNRDEGSERVGVRTGSGGFWFEEGGWASAASVCEARLSACENALRRVFQREATSLEPAPGGWRVLDACGHVLSEATVVVLANAREAMRLGAQSALPLGPVRGQITRLPQVQGQLLRAPVCGDGYVTPAVDGAHCIGATFEEDNCDCSVRDEDHAANLERLGRMLPDFARDHDSATLGGWAGVRAMTPDRLPLAGPVPGDGQAGLFSCVGLGARGLTWSALLGELVASYVNGDPLPVESHVAQQLLPGRRLPDVESS